MDKNSEMWEDFKNSLDDEYIDDKLYKEEEDEDEKYQGIEKVSDAINVDEIKNMV